MTEYLVLLNLNPTKLMDTLGAIRNMDEKPVDGVDLKYSINIFGSWDAGVWIEAEESAQALAFVQKKLKKLGIKDPSNPKKNEPIGSSNKAKTKQTRRNGFKSCFAK